MRLKLVDRLGNEDVVYLDTLKPALLNEYDESVLDLESNPFVQLASREVIDKPSTPTKTFLDAFILRPSPGISMNWVTKGDPELFDQMLPHFRDAIFVLTGKVVIEIG